MMVAVPAGRNSRVTTGRNAVAAAQQTQVLSNAAASHLAAISKEGEGPESCFDKHEVDGAPKDALFGQCTYGSRNGTKTMVLYADSRGPMWAAGLERVAAVTGWKLRVFSKGGCPVADLQYQNNETKAPDTDCDAFHTAAIDAIRKLNPQLVIAASYAGHKVANGEWPTTSQWQDAWISTLQKLAQPGTRLAVLGAIPTWENNDARCLAAHLRDLLVEQLQLLVERPDDVLMHVAAPRRTAGCGDGTLQSARTLVPAFGACPAASVACTATKWPLYDTIRR